MIEINHTYSFNLTFDIFNQLIKNNERFPARCGEKVRSFEILSIRLSDSTLLPSFLPSHDSLISFFLYNKGKCEERQPTELETWKQELLSLSFSSLLFSLFFFLNLISSCSKKIFNQLLIKPRSMHNAYDSTFKSMSTL